MINYAIELEFFVTDAAGNVVPAYKATKNLDGNPVVGEIRTGIFTNPTDLIFDLKKRLFLEQKALLQKGYKILLSPEEKLTREQLVALREDREYVNAKHMEVLKELSIYGKKTGKLLPRGTYKASLQINVSDNDSFSWRVNDKGGKEQKFERNVSNVFDYYTLLRAWDKAFTPEIARAKRVGGVYAIKSGNLGNRIEYRSLPNDVNLETLLEVLSEKV